MTATRAAAALLAGLWLAGCASTPTAPADGPPLHSYDLASVKPAEPKVEPPSRYGNPQSYVVFGKRYYVMDSAEGYRERGIASWYGRKFHGRRTSSGEPYDMMKMTAAHKSLPLPTYVRVTSLENGRSVIVRVNDRGPFVQSRIIDLSYAAARKLGIAGQGTGLVEVVALGSEVPDEAEIQALASPPGAGTAANSLYIQVGAYARRESAERVRAELVLNGIEEAVVKDAEGIFRVRIGPLASAELADRTAERLEALGVRDYHVVVID
jgi:rare lipoprotein A